MYYFRLLLVFLSLIFASSQSHAQIFDIKLSDAKKIKERKLIVVLADTTFAWGKRSNDLLKSIVPEYWDSISIEFMDLSQVRKLYAAKNTEYFTLEFSSLRNQKNALLEKLSPDVDPRSVLWNAKEHGYFDLALSENFEKPFYKFRTAVSAPIEGDFIIAVQQISKLFAYKKLEPGFSDKEYFRSIASKAQTLKDRTLNIDTLQLKRFFKTFAYVSEEYTQKYRLTDFADVTGKIRTSDSTAAYTAVIPYTDVLGRGKSFEGTAGGGMEAYEGNIYYLHVVIDARDGEIISFAKDENANIERRSLRQFVRYFE
ncbi:hypothetical protein [Sporocytophaga myxococcoides]|uniref:hypothetical protein n=1 Tax=Sporocytophaga myxococcoides TaxID=153721 RepID=UPI000407357F|nr:hypothetical protein [Sporocytophaga myxococcoides]